MAASRGNGPGPAAGSFAVARSVAVLTPRSTLPLALPAPPSYSSTRQRPTASEPATALRHDLIAGGVAGSAGIIVGHPLDSIKVRMQMTTASLVGSPPAQFTPKNMQFQLRSLFQGIGAPLSMAAVANATIFLTHGATMRLWDEQLGAEEGNVDSIYKTAICGGAAGFASAFVICPTEHIKTKLQTQQLMRTTSCHSSSLATTVYRDSYQAARHIFSTHGISGLYRGYVATTARQVPGLTVYFGTYDSIKHYTIHNMFGADHELLASITAGGLAGSCSWAMSYPMDFVKSRVQALPLDCSKSERSLLHILREVAGLHGWRAMYRGIGITILRAFPVNGIIFPTYELTLGALRRNRLQ